MKLSKILNEITEGKNDEQGVVSSDGKYIDLNIPSQKEIKFDEKVPQISYVKFKNGQMVRVSIIEPSDGLPILDQKKAKNYTETNEYWVKVIKHKKVEKIKFEDINIPIRLSFHYNPHSDQTFTVRDNKHKIVGVAIVADSEDKKSLHVFKVNIDEEYRGRGVGNAFYDFIEKTLGKKITRDTKGLYKALSQDGQRLWDRRNNR